MEAKRFKGKIIIKNRWVLDQLCDEDDKWHWSGKGSFTIFLKKRYGLTPQQYYNIVMFNNIDEQPLCLECKKPVDFINLHEGYPRYCSHWCSSSSEVTKRNRFLAYKYEYAKIYVAKLRDDPDHMKIGITGCDWNTRQSYQGHYLYGHQYLLIGNPKEVIDIELKLDAKFCDKNELFKTSDLDNIIKEIDLIKGSTTILNGSTSK